MIIVNSALMQDKIIKIVESIEDPKFTFVKKQGLKIYFETDMEDREEAAKIAKAKIKADSVTGSILFSVKTEEYI